MGIEKSQKLPLFILIIVAYIVYGGLVADAVLNDPAMLNTYLFQVMTLTMALFVIICNEDVVPDIVKKWHYILLIGVPVIVAAIVLRLRFSADCQPLSYIIYGVVAAVSEEMWMRKAFIDLARRTQKRYVEVIALVIGTVVWTSLHQNQGFLMFVLIFIIGLLLGFGYIITHDIRPFIFFHAAFNLIILL